MSDSGLIPLPRYFRREAEPNNHRLQQYHLQPSLLYSRSSRTSFSNLSLSLHSHIRESSIVVSTASGISLCSLHSHFYEPVSPLQDLQFALPYPRTNQSSSRSSPRIHISCRGVVTVLSQCGRRVWRGSDCLQDQGTSFLFSRTVSASKLTVASLWQLNSVGGVWKESLLGPFALLMLLLSSPLLLLLHSIYPSSLPFHRAIRLGRNKILLFPIPFLLLVPCCCVNSTPKATFSTSTLQLTVHSRSTRLLSRFLHQLGIHASNLSIRHTALRMVRPVPFAST
jgi:hypothetical protein